jgi:hypothetical protein
VSSLARLGNCLKTEGSRWIPGWWVDSSKIEELNRQDAKITERKKRMREFSRINSRAFILSASSWRLLASWRFNSPHFSRDWPPSWNPSSVFRISHRTR